MIRASRGVKLMYRVDLRISVKSASELLTIAYQGLRLTALLS